MITKKKMILLVCLLLVAVMLLSGCVKTTDIYGNERVIEHGLVHIGSIEGDGRTTIVYDPNTMICYMYISGPYKAALSPYYVLDEDGYPEIAVYGVNYGVMNDDT